MHQKRNEFPKDREKGPYNNVPTSGPKHGEESTCVERLMGEGNGSQNKIENQPQLVNILYYFFCFAYGVHFEGVKMTNVYLF